MIRFCWHQMVTLQLMSNDLQCYCDLWNLSISISNSKVMAFQSGGRSAGGGEWRYGSEKIEVTGNYKYLGVNFTTNLSMDNHIREKVSKAKLALFSSNGSLLIRNINFAANLLVFNAVSRAIVCYTPEQWSHVSSVTGLIP